MKGKVEKAAPPRVPNKKPPGLGKSSYPLAKGKGAAGPGANRVLKGTDKRGTGKVQKANERTRAKSLEGKYF